MDVAFRRLAPFGGNYENFLQRGGDLMDLLVLRLLLALVEQGVILSFRVTKDKIYLIIKK